MTDDAGAPTALTGSNAVIIAALLVLSFITYANTFGARFVWDDTSSFLLHQHVQDPSKFFQLFAEDQHAFGRGQGNFYRPLLSVTFMLDYALSSPSVADANSPSPFMFHFSSVAWHAFACVALYGLLGRLGAPLVVRTICAAIWTVHPLHTEAVAYMSGRADSMSAALMFSGIWLALSPATGRTRAFAVAGSCVLYAGAVLSKESSFIYPVLLGICLWASSQRNSDAIGMSRANRAAPLAGSLVVLAIYGVLRTTVLSFGAGGSGPGTALWGRIIETLQSLARYAELLIFPTGLHMERALADADTGTTLAGVAVLMGILALMIYGMARNRRRMVAGLAWFVVTWLPISGIFPLNAPMAEHWMYVPMAGLLWALLEFAIGERETQSPITTGVLIAASVWTLMLLFLSVERNYDWRTNESLFRATLHENPESTRVRFNLALTYEDAGNLPGASRQYAEMLRVLESRKAEGAYSGLRPEEIEALYGLGTIALQQSEKPLAGRYFQRLVDEAELTDHARPIAARAAFQLGRLYLDAGNQALGQQYLDQAVSVDPALASERARFGGLQR